jgi:hypothetical protein
MGATAPGLDKLGHPALRHPSAVSIGSIGATAPGLDTLGRQQEKGTGSEDPAPFVSPEATNEGQSWL